MTEEQQSAERPNARKVREGLVVSNDMDKTAVVAVVDRVRHPRYNKTVQRTKKLYVHDETNDVKVGDRVRVAETRPEPTRVSVDPLRSTDRYRLSHPGAPERGR